MDIGIVSMRYAKALMKYATDSNVAEQLYTELCNVEQNFRMQPNLRNALDNPILTQNEKMSLIQAATNKQEVCEEFKRFIILVLKNRRESFLQYICLSFIDLYRKSRHIGVAKLTTAIPISEVVKNRIRNNASNLLHANIELQTSVNPSIEGGFVFDINGYRLDASVASQLKKVRKQFIDRNKRIV